MTVSPGTYNVFNEDGTLFKWGQESVRATVTIGNRVRLYVGDNEEPIAEKHIPSHVKTLNDFDAYTTGVFQSALVLYATRLVLKLHKLQDAYQQIVSQKSQNFAHMVNGLIPVWRWIEKLQELNAFQETCEEILTETMNTLQSLAPEMLTTTFTIIFTEG